MPHEGYTDPITKDRPGFHSDIKASDVSSTPLVAKTTDGLTHETWLTPTKPHGARGLEPPDPNTGIHLTRV